MAGLVTQNSQSNGPLWSTPLKGHHSTLVTVVHRQVWCWVLQSIRLTSQTPSLASVSLSHIPKSYFFPCTKKHFIMEWARHRPPHPACPSIRVFKSQGNVLSEYNSTSFQQKFESWFCTTTATCKGSPCVTPNIHISSFQWIPIMPRIRNSKFNCNCTFANASITHAISELNQPFLN